MSKTTAWGVLRKRSVLKPYRMQMVQQLPDEDHRRRLDFYLQLQDLMSSDDHFLEKVQFSDEATFHVSGAVNRFNVRIWGSENPHACVEHQRDSHKDNVFCAISSRKVYGPFFFAEETVTGMSYLDMLHLWLMPQMQNIGTFIFQQDRSPAHFHCEVCQYLNIVLPGRWIGHASGNDRPLMLWPPSSPNITPCYNKVTNGCNSLFCVFISFFTLHVSGCHKPVIRGISSCFFFIYSHLVPVLDKR